MNCPKCNIKMTNKNENIIGTLNNDSGHLIMSKMECSECKLNIYLNGTKEANNSWFSLYTSLVILVIYRLKGENIMWTTPAATEMRFGFEVTMYVMNK